MNRIYLSCVFFLSILSAYSQRGVELKAQYGIGGIGYNYWITSNTLNIEANYNINEIVAVGPFFTTSFGSKYYVFDNTIKTDAKVTLIGINSNLTFLRLGRFRGYGNVNVFNIKGSTSRFTDANYSAFSNLEESMIGFGIGAGVLMNLGSGFAINLFDFKARFLKRDYLLMDQGIYRFYQFGLAYTFHAK